MSEPKRMTDEAVRENWRFCQDLFALEQDHLRARASEAEKDKVIKGAVDALELLRKVAHDNKRRAEALPLVDAVLRKHGRLP